MLLLAAFALPGLGCGSEQEPGETIRLVLPAGASRDMEAGRPVKGIPNRIEARVGDTLVVENRDSATQFVSGFAISPGQTVKIPLSREGTYLTNCSVHRERNIKMVVRS